MTWTSIFIAGFITYFSRTGMITLIDKDIFNENFRKILNYTFILLHLLNIHFYFDKY